MKKITVFLGIFILLLSPVLNAFAAGEDIEPRIAKFCKKDNGEYLLIIAMRAVDAPKKVSAGEFHTEHKGLIYKSIKNNGDVNLPPKTSNDTTEVTTGKIGYWDVKKDADTEVFELTLTAIAAATQFDIAIDVENTKIFSETLGGDAYKLLKNEATQELSIAVSDVPLCSAPPATPTTPDGDGTTTTTTTTNGDEAPPVTPIITYQTQQTTPDDGEALADASIVTPIPAVAPVEMHDAAEQEPAPQAALVQEQDATEVHAAAVPQPVQFREAASLQETGPAENMALLAGGLALAWAVFRFRKLFNK